MAFEAMLYTDAQRDEGVHGRLGFQFQAESPGVDADGEEFAKRLLYRVPIVLADAGAATVDFPESYSFLPDDQGRHYLARGRYLGACHDGRMGNQATHILLTADRTDLAPFVPAQLLSSPVWNPAKVPRSELEPIAAPLAIDPAFELPALHALVSGNSAAVAALPALVTMFEQAAHEAGKRLALVHPDPATIVRWIAIGSLFLDRSEAESLAFTVPTPDPLGDGQFPVVGVVPGSTMQPFRVGSDGVNSLDLETFEHGPVELSEPAARHAGWFLGGDPYLAIEAIEIARRWAKVVPAKAASLAAGALLLDERDFRRAGEAAAVVLRELANHREIDDLEEYGEELLDLVHVFDPARPAVRPVVEAWIGLTNAGHPALAASVALAALERAASDPASGQAWVRSGAVAPAAVDWDDEARRHAGDLIAGVLARLGDADLSAGFTWAATFGAEVPAEALGSPARRLSAQWVRNPSLTDEAGRWIHRDVVAAGLTQSLREAVSGPSRAEIAAAIHTGTWDWVMDSLRPQAPDALAPWYVGRLMANLSPPAGVALLRREAPSFGSADWDAIFDPGVAVDLTLLRVWLEVHCDAPRGLADLVDQAIGRATRDPSRMKGLAALLDVIARERPRGLSAAAQDLAAQAESFRRLLVHAVQMFDAPENTSIQELTGYDPRLIAINVGAVADAVVKVADSRSMADLLARSRLDLGIVVADAWRSYLPEYPEWTLGRGLDIWCHRAWPGSIRREVEDALVVAWTDPGLEEAAAEISRKALPYQREAIEALRRTGGIGGRLKRNVSRRWDARGNGPSGDGGGHHG